MNLYPLLRPLLFSMEAEKAHHFTLNSLKTLDKLGLLEAFLEKPPEKNLTKTVAGLSFKNPVGLAAGLDKNAEYVDELAKVGFGFIEVGTITPRPQNGNPQPRLFRIKQDEALLNRMGFNNQGADNVANRLEKRKSNIIIGANIGKNKVTDNDQAHHDYYNCFTRLYDVADYFVVNVSSPNTPGLRELQGKDSLQRIFDVLQDERAKRNAHKPLFLKIAPDLSKTQLEEVVAMAAECEFEGIISSNTTISRKGLTLSEQETAAMGAGGISGAPLLNRSNQVLQQVVQAANGNLAIIASGGIMNADAAKQKVAIGADLVQVYSGLIYHGPGLVNDILEDLQE